MSRKILLMTVVIFLAMTSCVSTKDKKSKSPDLLEKNDTYVPWWAF